MCIMHASRERALHLERAMKTRVLLLSAIPVFTAALSGCLDSPQCVNGESLVYDDSGQGYCVRSTHGYTSSSSPPSSSQPDAGSRSQEATPVATTTGADASTPSTPATPTAGDGTTPPPAGASACGGHDATGDSVRVVDKSDAPPALNGVAPNVADGTYALVQATFFRTGTAASPVRSLRASLDVHGATLALSAQDTSVAGLPAESFSLLTGSGNVTKTCEGVHGTVGAWFFPFAVGSTDATLMDYDGTGGFLRIVVSRQDGSTELVFAK
jgi:hypothetical protein